MQQPYSFYFNANTKTVHVLDVGIALVDADLAETKDALKEKEKEKDNNANQMSDVAADDNKETVSVKSEVKSEDNKKSQAAAQVQKKKKKNVEECVPVVRTYEIHYGH